MIKRKLYTIVFISLTFVLLSVTFIEKKSISKSAINLLTTKDTFIAGKGIVLEFEGNLQNKPQLFIKHTYGKTLLDGIVEKDRIQFEVPSNYSNKSGLLSWYLIEKNKEKAKGTVQIVSNDAATKLETYLGPPSTFAGDNNFVMFITLPLDNFDNPKHPETEVTIKHQFLNSIEEETKKTKNLIAWKYIYSPSKTGLILFSATCNDVMTKEFEAVIFPSIPTDFSIKYERNHEFADGNQITKIKTNSIKDKFGNIVSDGTLVDFNIIDNKNNILKTYGTTIEGIATGQILHPENEDNYKITAYVYGISKSNTIQIPYKSLNPTVDFSLSKDQRTITVGPIKSFMNQIVPDGIKVTLKVYHKNKLIETLTENSNRGIAQFYLSPEFYKEKKYTLEIETLGKNIKTTLINVVNK